MRAKEYTDRDKCIMIVSEIAEETGRETRKVWTQAYRAVSKLIGTDVWKAKEADKAPSALAWIEAAGHVRTLKEVLWQMWRECLQAAA